MNDNFDLRKFLVESKAIENMNPIFRKLNENTENTTAETTETTTTETLTENALRAKIREMVLNELGGVETESEMMENEDELYEAENNNLKEARFGTETTLGNLKDNVLFYFLKDENESDPKVYITTGKIEGDTIEVRSLYGDIIKANQNSEVVVFPIQNNKDRYKTRPLGEAKKDKEEELPADDAELDPDMAMDAEMDAPEDELTAAAAGATGDAKELINHLMTSLDTAKAMGNERLTTQILNTLKFAIDQSMAQ